MTPVATEEIPSVDVKLSGILPIDSSVRQYAYVQFCNVFKIKASHEKIKGLVEGGLEEIACESDGVRLKIVKDRVQVYGGSPALSSELSFMIRDYMNQKDLDIFGSHWHGGSD